MLHTSAYAVRSNSNNMCQVTVEPPKKVRSVRFNDNALETVVTYTPDHDDDDDDNRCRETFQKSFDVPMDNDSDMFYQRSGSHESLYDKISVEPSISMNIRSSKKRDSDLDNSNHRSFGIRQPFSTTTMMMDNIATPSRPMSLSLCDDDNFGLNRTHHSRRSYRKSAYV